MSIENNLKRIADALETIAANMGTANFPAEPKQEVPTSPAPEAPAQPAAQAPVPPAPPVTPPAPATQAPAMTAEELNAAIVEVFQRTNNRDGIMAILQKFGANGVSELAAEHYNAVLTEVQAL